MPYNPEHPRTLINRLALAAGTGSAAVTLALTAGCGGEFTPGDTFHTPFPDRTFGQAPDGYYPSYEPYEPATPLSPTAIPSAEAIPSMTASPAAPTEAAPVTPAATETDPTTGTTTVRSTADASGTCSYTFEGPFAGSINAGSAGRDGSVTLWYGPYRLDFDHGYHDLRDDVITDDAGNPVTDESGRPLTWDRATGVTVSGGGEFNGYMVDDNNTSQGHLEAVCALGDTATEN